MLTNILVLYAKKISTQNHASDPQNAAGHVIGQVAPVGHHRCTGDRGAERPNNGHKACKDHSLAAVFFIELMRTFQMALAKHEQPPTPIEGLARLSTDPVANLVPHDRAQRNEEEQFCDIEIPSRRKNARDDQKRIAGKEKSHEETC